MIVQRDRVTSISLSEVGVWGATVAPAGTRWHCVMASPGAADNRSLAQQWDEDGFVVLR